jgi:hypothetical protein
MRVALLLAALLLGPLAAPAVPAIAQCGGVPIYPGARPSGGDEFSSAGSRGSGYFMTDEPLVHVQRFYSYRLPGEAWAPVTPLPGQHPESFANPGYFHGNNVPEPVLEFSRGNAFVRIVGEAGGYSIFLDCR